MLKIEKGNTNEILRKVSEEIKINEIKKYVNIGKEMLKYIKNPDNGGIGLAAPQVGYNKRLIVVGLPEDRDDENFSFLMMINPVIMEHTDEVEVDTEGCLSLPGRKGEVERYSGIKLEYLDEKGQKRILVLNHLKARIVQHEIDHLNGILFTDKTLKVFYKSSL
ncbi:peptide deformylase [Candidatus Gracilibacteria bacterium]|nr:MAG: peptide deformylase [Candidatus Gracilibacteria bacterium]PIE84873.1 MAG: peptide deformylase [Candidatus Gracilibacteria bacterium]